MPLIIPKTLPAYDALYEENVFVMHRERALSQHIRPLEILILNLMPTKIATETQIARLLANTPIQVHMTLLQTASHAATHVSAAHLEAFYKTFDEVKNNRYDGMIITGAPVETMDFEQVDYWPELCEIMDFSETNVYSTLHVCWGAQAGLYYHYGVHKELLPEKMFGVFDFYRAARAAGINPILGCSSTGSPARRTLWCAALTRCSMRPTAATPASAGPMWMPATRCASWPRAMWPGPSS